MPTTSHVLSHLIPNSTSRWILLLSLFNGWRNWGTWFLESLNNSPKCARLLSDKPVSDPRTVFFPSTHSSRPNSRIKVIGITPDNRTSQLPLIWIKILSLWTLPSLIRLCSCLWPLAWVPRNLWNPSEGARLCNWKFLTQSMWNMIFSRLPGRPRLSQPTKASAFLWLMPGISQLHLLVLAALFDFGSFKGICVNLWVPLKVSVSTYVELY